MNVRRVAWFGVSALAIATWFAAASTSGVRTPIVPDSPIRPTALDRSSAVLKSEIARLHDRIGPSATPSRSRDLFRFNARAPRHPAPAPPADAAATESVPPPAPRPSLKLIGIAEDVSDAGTIRTAIVSGLGDVYLVKPGDTFGAGQYRVEQVSADAVQLTDTATALSTTLALR
jgi:hypothetical protein